MKRYAYWLCALLAVGITVAMFYWYGVTPFTLAVALLLLTCPIGVIWLTLRLSKQSEREVNDAVHQELESRKES